MITQTRPEVRPDPPRERPRRSRLVVIGLVALLLIGAVGARAWWSHRKADIRAGTTLVDAQGMAALYGIDIKLIAVTAAGGLIDFRYQVTDPDKANAIIHDLNLFPKLIVEDTGETLALRSLPHSHKAMLELGGSYFFLLPNAHNAVHPGTLLTLVIGDARLEHYVVQG
jgi:hypothetical protein